MTLAIFFNFLFVFLVTYIKYRDVISEARRVVKANNLLETKAEKIKNYVNRRGTRGITHHTDGRWEYTRPGTNPPPPTFSKPPPPPNPPRPKRTIRIASGKTGSLGPR